MNKFFVYILLLSSFCIQAQFVEFDDTCAKNKFLGFNKSMCSLEATNKNSKNYQASYDCANGSVSDHLNINFLDTAVIGQQFYIFNDFINTLGIEVSKGFRSNESPDSTFSGGGIFVIEIGTHPVFLSKIQPTLQCPAGTSKLAAQLRYNNGSTITTWSQDAICLSHHDSFTIKITSEKDTTAPAYISDSVETGSNTNDKVMTLDTLNKDSGPTKTAYEQAKTSPRTIKLIKKG